MILVLPGMQGDELRYTIEACRTIASACETSLTVVGRKLYKLLPYTGGLLVDAYDVIAGDLFDDATAVMLSTAADSHSLEAARVLREAIAEPTADGKKQLRTRAATMLHTAYSEYKSSAEVRTAQIEAIPTWRVTARRILMENLASLPNDLQSHDEIIDLHAKAACRELDIALINWRMGLLSATASRVDSAEDHFIEHYSLRIVRTISGSSKLTGIVSPSGYQACLPGGGVA